MKYIILILALAVSVAGKSQVIKVDLLASGLTCSMCSNAIHKSLEKLDFVDVIRPNIEEHTFNITFKEGMDVDFDKIRKRVEDAGFFVAVFTATFRFDNVRIKNNAIIHSGVSKFQFVGITDQLLQGEVTLRFQDKGFVSSKKYKKDRSPAADNNVALYHVTI